MSSKFGRSCDDVLSMRRALRSTEAITQIRLPEHPANRVSLIYKTIKPQLYRTCVKLSAADVKGFHDRPRYIFDGPQSFVAPQR